MDKDNIRPERHQLFRVFAMTVDVAHAPAVDLQVATFGPAQFLQASQKSGEANLCFGIIGGKV